MSKQGRLIVLEGPDGGGKSTLVKELYKALVESGLDVRMLSFPGKEAGTLGGLVYQVHHNPADFGIPSINPTSKQILHVAAHIETIINTILPALDDGKTVILDRFWWSTWVYGIYSKVTENALRGMLSVEYEAWGEVLPAVLFVLLGTSSKRNDEIAHQRKWDEISALYRNLASDEAGLYPIEIIENNTSIEKAASRLVNLARTYLEENDNQLK